MRPCPGLTTVELRWVLSMLYTCLYYCDDRVSNMSQGIHLDCMIAAVDIEHNSTRPLIPSMRDRIAGHAGEIHRSIAFVAAEDLSAHYIEAVEVVSGDEEMTGDRLVVGEALNLQAFVQICGVRVVFWDCERRRKEEAREKEQRDHIRRR